MNRVSVSTLQQKPNRLVSTAKQLHSKLQSTPVAFWRNGLLAMLVFAVFAVTGHYAGRVVGQKSAPSIPATIAVQKKATPTTPQKIVTQTNPLFATTPSWSQDFSGKLSGTLDQNSWNVLVGPAQNSNHEQQYYSGDIANLRVENGALRLIATQRTEPNGFQYGSARLETQGKKSFLYGRIDVTAKLPAGVGTWPAVWLLPDNNTYEDKSPANDPERYRNGGEIDIIEGVGFLPNKIYGIAHSRSDLDQHSEGVGSYNTVTVPTSTTAFNKYTLLWTPTTMTYEVNDKPFYTYSRQANADYTSWPFDQPFYMIANLAIGGSWGGIQGINNSALPASLDIQSIYYYPYVGK